MITKRKAGMEEEDLFGDLMANVYDLLPFLINIDEQQNDSGMALEQWLTEPSSGRRNSFKSPKVMAHTFRYMATLLDSLDAVTKKGQRKGFIMRTTRPLRFSRRQQRVANDKLLNQLLEKSNEIARRLASLFEETVHPTLDSLATDMTEIMDREDASQDGIWLWLNDQDPSLLSPEEMQNQLRMLATLFGDAVKAKQEMLRLNELATSLEEGGYDEPA